MDAARRDTQIDRDARAELERSLQELDAVRIDGDAERAAAAEDVDGEAERLFPGAEIEAHAERLPDEGNGEAGAEAEIGQAHDAQRDAGQGDVEAGIDALGRDVEMRRIAEAVERDQIAQALDEAERSDELDTAHQDVDIHLRCAVDAELDLLEIELQETCGRDQDQVELLQAADHADLGRGRAVLLDLGLDGHQEPALVVGTEDRIVRVADAGEPPAVDLGVPVEPDGELFAGQHLDHLEQVGDPAENLRDSRHGVDDRLARYAVQQTDAAERGFQRPDRARHRLDARLQGGRIGKQRTDLFGVPDDGVERVE